MRKLVAPMIAMASVLVWSTSMAQTNPFTVMAEFPGASLKWVRIAEPEFERRKLDLDNYTIAVIEEGDSVVVLLRSPDAVGVPGARGSTGKFPGFEVEISKKDRKVVRSNYVR